MKEFCDIWLLARQYDFSGADLAPAITRIFANRGTALDPDPIALTEAFTNAERARNQWAAFVHRSSLGDAPDTLDEIREPFSKFVLPVVAAITEKRAFTGTRMAGGP